MGVYIDLYKIDYNKYKTELMKRFPRINDEKLLKKIMCEFGTFITENDFIILHNEYYEDGICTWNMDNAIEEVFHLKDDPDYDKWDEKIKDIKSVQEVFFVARTELIGYKELYEAMSNLGFEHSGEDE